ncbi:MAG: lamin tail domain-containing protein [Candidatus Uhrbacteria bacterium]|nr:lamin tail domain-containing protein [Candidatus Uhrbacteria bacterium]
MLKLFDCEPKREKRESEALTLLSKAKQAGFHPDPRWLMLIMLLTVAALPVRTHASTPTIVISEIAWAGSSISSSDEWIELVNLSDDSIDLSGWILTGAGSSDSDFVLPEGAVVASHSTYLMANYEHTHENSALESAPDFITSTLSLSNSGFNLSLYDTGNALIDVAGGTGAPFAGGSGGTGDSPDGRYTSMVRVDGLGDGSLEESWADADTASGFKAGVEDLGTPGVAVFTAIATEPEVIQEEVADESVHVLINEFVVDPNEGEDEWIELVNVSTESIDLTGWTLEDSTGKQTVLEDTIGASEYLLVTAPLGKLNNDTDSILLKDATGMLVDSLEYGTEELSAPKDGAALARGASGSFELTYATTPGEANVIDPEKPEVEVVETVSANIRISEFVVDPPEDGGEWIELYNGGDSSATLEGWTIEDAAGQVTDLSTVTINAGAYVIVEEPKGKLNNDGDSIILKDATSTVVETVVYGGDGYVVPKDGEALARNGETFEITQEPTPGSENVIVISNEEETQEESAGEEVEEEVEEVEDESSSSVVSPGEVGSGSTGSQASEVDGSQVEEEIIEEVELVKTLRFVTLYPNATGVDEEEEYLVIENTGTEPIDLLEWSIEDGSTDGYTFATSIMIEAGATLTLGRPESKLTLNNGGDTLKLIAPDGDVVDLVTYETSTKGATYDLVNGTWMWSGTTIVTESTITESGVIESTTTSAPATTSTTTTVSRSTNVASINSTASVRVAQSMTIAQAKEKADGQMIQLIGVVTAVPGTFGSQLFYLQDETGGIQVYLYSGDFPELALGDSIQVKGTLSTSRGERRVKLASATGVVSASGTFTSQPIELAVSAIDESFIGLLMKTQGQIQSIDTNKLLLEYAGATLTVYLKSNPVIDAQQFERGDKIELVGVLTSYDGELRLRPRSVDDITVVSEAVGASAVVTESSGNSSAGMILLITTMVALAILALWHYLPRRRLTSAAV